MKVIEFIKRWIWSILCVGVVLWLTLSSDPLDGAQEMIWFEGADKLVHAIMFGGVVSALMFDYKRGDCQRVLSVGTIVSFAIGGAVFGIADELAQQYLTVARSGEVLDFVADISGIILASLLAPPVINLIFNPRR